MTFTTNSSFFDSWQPIAHAYNRSGTYMSEGKGLKMRVSKNEQKKREHPKSRERFRKADSILFFTHILTQKVTVIHDQLKNFNHILCAYTE